MMYQLTNQAQATAVNGRNFLLLDSVYKVEFSDGQREGWINIKIINDTTYEASEFFFLQLYSASPSTAKLGAILTTVVYIADDGDAGEFNFVKSYIFCREDNGTALVPIHRSLGSSSSYTPVKLTVATMNSSSGSNATQGSSRAYDYTAKTEDLVWANGEIDKWFSVRIFNNMDYNPLPRSIRVRMTAVQGGAAIGSNSDMWIYIIDDRDAGTLSFEVDHYEVLENSTSLRVQINRTGLVDSGNVNTYTSGLIAVDVSTYSGLIVPGRNRYDLDYDYGIVATRRCTHVSPCTAEEGLAYTAISSTTIAFANGESSKSVDIFVHNDDIFQAPDRVFKLILQNVTGGAHIGIDYEHPPEWFGFRDEFMALEARKSELLDNVGTIVTIRDDGDPAVVISKASVSLSEIGLVDAFTVTLNSQPSSDVTLQFNANPSFLMLTLASLTITPLRWNEQHVIQVSPVADNLSNGLTQVEIEVACTSLDLAYSSPLRASMNSTGFVLAIGVYTQLSDSYETGNLQHEFPWSEEDGVLTSPASRAVISAFCFDDDPYGVLVYPESVRHASGHSTPQNFVCVRDGGHNASVRIALASEPKGVVSLGLLPSTGSGLYVDPPSLQFSAADWNSAKQVIVSGGGGAIDSVEFSEIKLLLQSNDDPVYDRNATEIAGISVQRFPGASVVLDSASATTREASVDENEVLSYSVNLGSEPMHWEPEGNAYVPRELVLGPDADTTLNCSAFTEGSLGQSEFITVAGNASTSTIETPVAYIAAVRFNVQSAISESTGSTQVGLARLRLYRVSGGENNGLGGIAVGVVTAVPGTSDSWFEQTLHTNCAAGNSGALQCTLVDGEGTPPDLPLSTTFDTIQFASEGEKLVSPGQQVNQTTNTFIPTVGWLEIDVTVAINKVMAEFSAPQATQTDTSVTFFLYARSQASFIYNGVNEVVFASREHADSELRPQLCIVASGRLNLAHGADVRQSQFGRAEAAIDGETNSILGVASSYAMSPTVVSYPWWEADLGAIRLIEDIVVIVKNKASAAAMTDSQLALTFWVFLSAVSLAENNDGVSGFLEAQANASCAKRFEVTSRGFQAPETSSAMLRWHVNGETNGHFTNNTFEASYSTPVEARYVLIQIEGQNGMALNEVEVYQQALAGTRISVGGYLPSVAAEIAAQNQVVLATNEFQDDLCDQETHICRHELLFTSGNWGIPQSVRVRAVSDDVVTGDRDMFLTHAAESLDPDYVEGGLCAVPSADYPNAQMCRVFSDSSFKQVTILEDDENVVILSKERFLVLEGSAIYPGAPRFCRNAPVYPLTLRCSDNPERTIQFADQPELACARAFAGRDDWEVCRSAAGSPALSSGSAWIMAQLASPSNITEILLVIPEMQSSKYIKTLSLWWNSRETWNITDQNYANLTDGWEKFSSIEVPMMSSGVQTIQVANLSLAYATGVLVSFDETYDDDGGCLYAPTIDITRFEPIQFPLAVRGDITDPNSVPPAESYLSRMHSYGASDLLHVRLASEPIADVHVSAVSGNGSGSINVFDARNASSDPGALQDIVGARYQDTGTTNSFRAPTSIVFNASNWNISQTLTFMAIDDNFYDANRTLSVRLIAISNDATDTIIPAQSFDGSAIVTSVATLPLSATYGTAPFVVQQSSDSAWPHHLTSSWSSPTGEVTVSLVDDDIPGITVSTSVVTVSESGPDGSFSILLDSAPTTDVDITVVYEKNSGLLTLNTESLRFLTTNWFEPQAIVVHPVPNDVFDAAAPFTLNYTKNIPKANQPLVSLQATSADPNYNGISLGGNENDRTLGYVVHQGVFLVVEDDDTGCASEYSCKNRGECLRLTGGNICRCPVPYGMKNCSFICESSRNCEFRRLSLRLRCRPNGGAVCGSTFAPGLLVSTLHRMLADNEFVSLNGQSFPKLSLPVVSEALYVANSSRSVCTDGSENCLTVQLDLLGNDYIVVDKIMAYAEAGSLQSPPLNIESVTAVQLYSTSLTTTIAVWLCVGVCIVCILTVGGLMVSRYLKVRASHVMPEQDDTPDPTGVMTAVAATDIPPPTSPSST